MTKDVIAAIEERRSVRRFKPDPVPAATIGRLLEAARRAPSAGNIQPWHFTVVLNERLRRGLAEAGIEADAPVNIRLQDVPAEMVLGLMLGQLGLDYYIKHGVIVVTTAEKAVADLEVRVYPVQDLIEPVGLTRRSPDTEASRLTDVIQSSVEPESWQDNGGRGTVRYYRGTLVVLQTAKVHQAVERLLSELRQATKHAAETEPPAKQAPLPKDEPPAKEEPPQKQQKESRKQPAAPPQPEP